MTDWNRATQNMCPAGLCFLLTLHCPLLGDDTEARALGISQDFSSKSQKAQRNSVNQNGRLWHLQGG